MSSWRDLKGAARAMALAGVAQVREALNAAGRGRKVGRSGEPCAPDDESADDERSGAEGAPKEETTAQETTR